MRLPFIPALVILVLAAPAAASASYPYAATVDYWRSTQQADGTIAGPTGKVEGYGTVMMGAAFAQDGAPASAALAATNWIAKGKDDPFSILAATVIYEHADQSLRALLAPTIRTRLEATIPLRLGRYTDNWSIVEAAAAVRADNLGLGAYRAAAEAWIVARYLPVMRQTGGYGGDIWTWPLAYHAFATGLLAMVAEGAASPAIRAAAVRSCRVLEATTSPRGIVAWYGRSQLESFAQASAVLALRTCERYAPKGEAGRFEIVAHRTEVALQRLYPVLPSGRLAIIPRYVVDPTPYRGADAYAHEDGYTAFTLVLLGLAPPWQGVTSPAASRYVSPLGDRAPALVAARTRTGWLGISVRPGWTTLASRGPRDGRYGFGVQRAETAGGQSIVPAPAISSPPDLDLEAATGVVADGRGVSVFGPGYGVRFTVVGCSVIERVTVRHRRTLVIGARIATDARGRRLGSLATSRKLLYRHFWKAYGADSRRLENVRGIVRIPARGSVTITRTGCR